jgi:hypothetical protein
LRNLRRRDHIEDLGVDGRLMMLMLLLLLLMMMMIMMMMMTVSVRNVWTVFCRLNIGESGGLL